MIYSDEVGLEMARYWYKRGGISREVALRYYDESILTANIDYRYYPG